jgi:hypothetical protein
MKRFWKEARAVERGDGWGVELDGMPLRTPGKKGLTVPSVALAEAIAAEWSGTAETIDPRAMPLTGFANAARRFGAPAPSLDNINDPVAAKIPRPPFWGGFYVWADSVELWVEGASRIHERARWTRSLTTSADGPRTGPWSATRLQP